MGKKIMNDYDYKLLRWFAIIFIVCLGIALFSGCTDVHTKIEKAKIEWNMEKDSILQEQANKLDSLYKLQKLTTESHIEEINRERNKVRIKQRDINVLEKMVQGFIGSLNSDLSLEERQKKFIDFFEDWENYNNK